jgi:NADPH:quinone reductase-like Zn-dependent oxidoreductase
MKYTSDCQNLTAVGHPCTRTDCSATIPNNRLTHGDAGSWSQFAKSPESYVALKPSSLSFEEAASLPLAAMTAFQALKKYNGSLAGKTVFVPAGCEYIPRLLAHAFVAGYIRASANIECD